MRNPFAITVGDPAGIGPDIVLALAERDWPVQLVAIGDRDLLQARAEQLQRQVNLIDYDATDTAASRRGGLRVLHQPLEVPAHCGQADSRNAAAILRSLQRAVEGCVHREFSAMVTAPVSKAVIADSGTAFLGHTEYLAELTGTERVVMLLASENLRVALATTHLPLAAVPAALNRDMLRKTLLILHRELKRRFAMDDPRIAVLGLNPHAGESGKLGREEIEIISPVLEALRGDGLRLHGPLPADTAFGPQWQSQCDAYLAMYHDQGLPVLKYASFGHAVNITLGLPIIRTSVDHGTAFDLAGSGRANPGSLYAAVDAALSLK